MRQLTKPVLFLIFACCLGQSRGLAQSTQTFTTVSEAMVAVSENYKVLTGLDEVAQDTDKAPITLDFALQNVTQALNTIIAQRPGYTWSFEDGVYDVYPKISSDSLSELNVSSFTVSGTALEADNAINKLPELRAWLSDHHLMRNEIKSSPGFPRERQRISIALTDVHLRNVLNQLVQASGDKRQWHIFRWGDKMQYVGISFFNL